jgi:DNA polymerase-4/DNA polymerase V
MNKLVSINNFSNAILHIDGDAFFASCHQAINPDLKDKPVVVGKDRGIATAVSYQAKEYGIKRGMRYDEIKKLCPKCIFIQSNYHLYHLYSSRLFNIIKKFTPQVEKYSVDECFADITGLRRLYNSTYLNIAHHIKQEIEQTLDLTVSVGLAPNKTIAKIASEWDKPSGLVSVPGKKVHLYLNQLKPSDVWGIGSKTNALLEKLGVKTALDFAYKDEQWVRKYLTKPHLETWQELNGKKIFLLNTENKRKYKSITRSKTFSPTSKDKLEVFAQLSKNIEKACTQLRKLKLVPQKIKVFIKTQSFEYFSTQIKLDTPNNYTDQITKLVKQEFEQIFDPSEEYRATGIVMKDLIDADSVQMGLFSAPEKLNDKDKLFDQVDSINSNYGENTLFMGSSLNAVKKKNKKFGLPFLGRVK